MKRLARRTCSRDFRTAGDSPPGVSASRHPSLSTRPVPTGGSSVPDITAQVVERCRVGAANQALEGRRARVYLSAVGCVDGAVAAGDDAVVDVHTGAASG